MGDFVLGGLSVHPFQSRPSLPHFLLLASKRMGLGLSQSHPDFCRMEKEESQRKAEEASPLVTW